MRPRGSLYTPAVRKLPAPIFCLALSLALPMGAVGCRHVRSDPEQATRQYPFWLLQGEVLDVQASEVGDSMRLVNASLTDLRDVDVWLNQRYLFRLDRLAPGETRTIPLARFWDVRGEGPNPGGLLRFYKPTPIRLVQFQVEGAPTLYGAVSTLTELETR